MTNVTRAPNVTAAQASAFMGKLFDPLPDAELADRELARLESKARSALRDALMEKWLDGHAAMQVALCEYHWVDAKRYLADRTGVEAPASAVQRATRIAFERAVARQMMLPAPKPAQLHWKREHLCIADSPEIRAAIAADEARLSKAR